MDPIVITALPTALDYVMQLLEIALTVVKMVSGEIDVRMSAELVVILINKTVIK
jgi:hypothetical protein